MKKLLLIASTLLVNNVVALENSTIPEYIKKKGFKRFTKELQERYRDGSNKAFEIVCGDILKKGEGLSETKPRSTILCAQLIKSIQKAEDRLSLELSRRLNVKPAIYTNEEVEKYFQKSRDLSKKIIADEEKIKQIQEAESEK